MNDPSINPFNILIITDKYQTRKEKKNCVFRHKFRDTFLFLKITVCFNELPMIISTSTKIQIFESYTYKLRLNIIITYYALSLVYIMYVN